MKKRKKIMTIAIDSPAAAGAGTQAKYLSKEYNLLYLDTGKIYRMIAFIKINQNKKYNKKFLKKRIENLKLKTLQKNELLSDKIGTEASIIAKENQIRSFEYHIDVSKELNCDAQDLEDVLQRLHLPVTSSITRYPASHLL
mgnify:CR=1 FL=1